MVNRALADNGRRWDQLRHAPLCDDRTNELICLYLELVRLAASSVPVVMYQETLEPFAVYALRRLNKLFNMDIVMRGGSSRKAAADTPAATNTT